MKNDILRTIGAYVDAMTMYVTAQQKKAEEKAQSASISYYNGARMYLKDVAAYLQTMDNAIMEAIEAGKNAIAERNNNVETKADNNGN